MQLWSSKNNTINVLSKEQQQSLRPKYVPLMSFNGTLQSITKGIKDL